jgi:3' terminal RNA ribose 2'-O-methyltransferase Hen1
VIVGGFAFGVSLTFAPVAVGEPDQRRGSTASPPSSITALAPSATSFALIVAGRIFDPSRNKTTEPDPGRGCRSLIPPANEAAAVLLTVTTTHAPALDLGYLLHKHPGRAQSFALSFGTAHVFYPEANADRCTACLLLDVDAVGLARRDSDQRFLAAHYVNDRPYCASSFLSVAIAQVFGSALQGRCKDRPELAATPVPLTARLDVLPVRGGERFLRAVFEPLGYQVEAARRPLDERFPEWGDSPYFSVAVHKTTTLCELLTHLYVLAPVFDNQKHYWVGDDEMEKLLAKGRSWLPQHPLKEEIARRFLKSRPNLVREALSRLVPEEAPDAESEEAPAARPEDALEKPLSLNDQRLAAVVKALKSTSASRVLDLGCGEGKLLRELFAEKQFTEIVGLDVSVRSLEIAARRLKLERLPERSAQRLRLLHGSLTYRDKRLAGFDAAAVVEVIEHLDPPRLTAFERVLFECARPSAVVLTTPNREYNVTWETLPAGQFRHPDHRFEWTRQEFAEWAKGVSERHGYAVEVRPVGPVDEKLGPPTQMAVFQRNAAEGSC